MNDVLPVLIIGAGPAGLSAAIELGMRDIECVLIEPRTAVSHARPRGKTTHARTMEHFRRWGIAEELRASTPTPPTTFHDVAFCTSLLGSEIHRMTNALGLFPDKHPEMAETSLFVGQPHVEEALRRRIASLDAVDARFGARATGRLTEYHDCIEVEVDDPLSGTKAIRARYVIAADGPRSGMRLALGIPLQGGTAGGASISALFRAPGLWKRVEHSPAVFYWCIGENGAGNLAPYDPGRDLWVASWQRNNEIDPLTAVTSLIGDAAEVEIVTVDEWHSSRAIAERYRVGRLFLVGDAARQTPPWGGHGYNTCVLDAIDLSWKLAAVLKGWAAEPLLDTYEEERRPVALHVIETSSNNQRILSAQLVRAGVDLPGTAGENARASLAAEIEQAKRSEFYSLGLVLGYTYADSAAVCWSGSSPASNQSHDVSTYVPSFGPGSRLPHCWLQDGRSLYDLLADEFTLLVHHRHSADAIVRAAGKVPVSVLSSEDLPDAYKRPAYVLVRPDQHVTWSGDSLDISPSVLWSTAVQSGLHVGNGK